MPRPRTRLQGTPFNRAIGERIRAARVARHASQMDLALVLGVSTTAVGFWETGRNQISTSRLVTIASALGVPPASLFPDASVFPLAYAA
jgi:transcriptional regulator with XRE-family HTH domain